MKIGVATCKPGKQFERVGGTKGCEEETKSIFCVENTTSPSIPITKLCISLNGVFIGRTATHSDLQLQEGCFLPSTWRSKATDLLFISFLDLIQLPGELFGLLFPEQF